MLAWYHSQFGYVFEHFGPVRGLPGLIHGVTPTALAALTATAGRFAKRGQLGRFWSTLRFNQG